MASRTFVAALRHQLGYGGGCSSSCFRGAVLTEVFAHQIATRAIGGTVAVTIIRDPAEGSARYAVSYESRGEQWISWHRFPDVAQADAGALVLADFLGCEVRG